MNIKSLTAPCGIDCFNCQVYVDNIKEQLKSYLAQALKKPMDEVACQGCRQENGCRLHYTSCDTLNCAQDKQVEFCYECDLFPCSKFIPCADQAEKYPHNYKIYNLCRISKIGLEAWSQEAADIRKKYFQGKLIVDQGPICS